MKGDGDASPLLVDLAGNDTNQLIVANSDGWIHAYQYNPTSGTMTDLPGWPVHTEPLPLHTGEHGLHERRALDGALRPGARGARPPATCSATARMDDRGRRHAGQRLRLERRAASSSSTQTSNPNYSGAPLAGDPAWAAQRAGTRERTEGGFLTSPVLANLEPAAGPRARHHRRRRGPPRLRLARRRRAGQRLPGARRGPQQGRLGRPDEQPADVQRQRARANPGKDEDQGKIVDTPAVAYLDGPGKPPSIIVGHQRGVPRPNTGNEGAINAAKTTHGLARRARQRC